MWFKDIQGKNVRITSDLLREKAIQFAQKLGDNKFDGSLSWIQRFRQRHNIVYGKVSGEANDAPTQSANDWIKSVWPKVKENYSDDDIYNAYETALFFRATADKTLKFKGEKCIGGKLSKDRITVLVVVNMTGTDKRKLFVIGKSKKPRCFKDKKQLPVEYTANRKAWMTSSLFEDFLRKWDNELARKNKKILLVVDNCTAHPAVQNIKNINLVFLPPNTTAIIQPLDQGIIRSLKTNYRKIQLLNQVKDLDEGRTPKKLNVYDAIIIISRAWSLVTVSTIRNCFSHAGFSEKGRENEDDEDDLPLAQWIRNQAQCNGSESLVMNEIFSMDNWIDLVAIDNDVYTSSELNDEDIIFEVQSEKYLSENEGDDEDNAENNDGLEAPSVNQAWQAFQVLRHFYLINEDEQSNAALTIIDKNLQKQMISNIKLKQLKITDLVSISNK